MICLSEHLQRCFTREMHYKHQELEHSKKALRILQDCINDGILVTTWYK